VRALLIIGLMSFVCGCASLKREPDEPSSLPPIQSATDSVGLEIVFLKLSEDAELKLDPMWAEIDETHLPTQLRRQLDANGIRCGLLGSHLPPSLQQLIDATVQPAPESVAEGVRISDGPIHTCRQLQSPTGQRSELLASEVVPEIAVLNLEQGQVVGKTYRGAQCLWALTTFPQGDGRVLVRLTPEVHFGQPENQFVGQSSGIFRQVSARRRKSFDNLQVEAIVAPGQTLLLTGTIPARGLGRHFFSFDPSANSEDSPGRKLLMIRLARTHYDDLFSAERISAPILPAGE
jgi:hypothetical protein